MNWLNVAALGLGLTKGRDAAQEKKKKDRAALLATTQRMMAERDQNAQKQAELAQRTAQNGVLNGIKSDMNDIRRTQAGTGETRAQAYSKSVTGYTDPSTGAWIPGGNAVRAQGNNIRGAGVALSHTDQLAANPDLAGMASGITGGLVPPTVKYSPSALSSAKATNLTANTGKTVTETGLIVPKYKQAVAHNNEIVRHNKAGEAAAKGNSLERGRHNRADEALGVNGLGERIRHNGVAETQGEERIGQGATRLSIEQMRMLGMGGAAKGQPTFKDYQGIIERNNAEKNKVLSGLQVWDKKANKYSLRSVTPHEQSIINQADYNIHQAQHGQRAAARGVNAVTGQVLAPMSPIGNGFQIMPLPGLGNVSSLGNVSISTAPPLPGSQTGAPVHHSHIQPRRKTGTQAGQFKKGKTDLSKIPTARLMKMISGG